MDKQQLENRLEVTEEQIELIKSCRWNAVQHQEDFSATIYTTMISGYDSQIKDLASEAETYRKQLQE